MIKHLLLVLAASLYKLGVVLRGKLFDAGVFHSEKFKTPIICIGNITVGGTGKTPMSELVISHFVKSHSVALISRGYSRKTKGYREVEVDSNYLDVGDEPLQIKRKFPTVKVIVCENRVEGIRRIESKYPEVGVIIMDDGFQHRHVSAPINIVMLDATRPVQDDNFLPLGSLRDTINSLHRANYFVVTKCPLTISPLDRRIIHKVVVSVAYQHIYYTRYKAFSPESVIPGVEIPMPTRNTEVIAMSGIANNTQFVREIQNRYKVVDSLAFNDHHRYVKGDLKMMTSMLNRHPNAVIITTEKDAVKLMRSRKIPATLASRLLYIPISIDFIDDNLNVFLEKLTADVKKYS
ncbi:MAG: tetraacyldisaccharide 4'-kinase [Rikenellaceae bacterium]